jgi:hypothetical protein
MKEVALTSMPSQTGILVSELEAEIVALEDGIAATRFRIRELKRIRAAKLAGQASSRVRGERRKDDEVRLKKRWEELGGDRHAMTALHEETGIPRRTLYRKVWNCHQPN